MNRLVGRRARYQTPPLPSEIPPSWLAAIKDAVKPVLWPSLLGSAVLAALIGLASSYITARMTISGQLRVESEKARFQFQQERAKQQIQAYQVLGNKLKDLGDAYLSYLIFVAAAQQHGMNAVDRKNLLLQANAVGKLEREVITARHVSNLSKIPLLKNTDACLAEVAATLQAGQQNPVSALERRDLVDRLQRLGNEAQDQADTIRTEPSNVAPLDR
jgi:hypothetical protein